MVGVLLTIEQSNTLWDAGPNRSGSYLSLRQAGIHADDFEVSPVELSVLSRADYAGHTLPDGASPGGADVAASVLSAYKTEIVAGASAHSKVY